ncbi:MAG: EamA family transporter [Gammaproteobacteria bacterium]|nr:EamA family transporter [Gammaproteobacteria bacterium]MYD75929.1 EamA family transporter [Gammaproteobacteria bacterium]MYJ52720.1 EamA family transporter [Gammaproteobacteria bacterium]
MDPCRKPALKDGAENGLDPILPLLKLPVYNGPASLPANIFMKVFYFALIAAIGNAMFVYGQRASSTSENPFYFLFLTLAVCIALFLASALISKGQMTTGYIVENQWYILVSGVGFFVTFIGFYWLYNQQGATGYIVYALLSILTTSIGVGLILFREPFNRFHVISGILAAAAIVTYGIGQSRLEG